MFQKKGFSARLPLMLAAAAVLLLVATPAAAEVIFNESVPAIFGANVPCANGGDGEFLSGIGSIHIVISVQEDGAGGQHFRCRFNFQGFSATGEETGDTYRVNGNFGGQANFTASGTLVASEVINLNLVGPGPGNNLRLRNTLHITINDNNANVNVDSVLTCQ